MQPIRILVALLAAAVAPTCSAVAASEGTSAVTGDRTITRVVKLLQEMLDKSKAEDDEERTLYGKYKCYCDKNEAAKKESIATLSEQIGLLESGIAELQGKNGVLSSETAQLQADMATNEEAQAQANKIRGEENAAYEAFKTDSEGAISQMSDAIEVLSEIGADQTLGESAADHERFMKGATANSSLVKLHQVVKQALVAASSFTSKKQVHLVESFLQAPFTGTYTAQAGEVVGILKDMRDTFKSNLASAVATEKAAVAAHDKYIANMVAAYDKMASSYESKQDLLSANDDALSSKKDQLSVAEDTKASDEAFLTSLLDMCAAKATDYNERNLLRKSEQAAITEAIAILNSDAAFETFGKVSATSTGETSAAAASFMQRIAVRHHTQTRPFNTAAANQVSVEQAKKVLRKAANGRTSNAVSRVLSLLEAGNPFTVVLAEINKMIALISKEQEVDQGQLDWCNSERKTNNDKLAEKEAQIITLNSAITELETLIDNPTTGLRFQIKETEASLVENSASQTSETADRKSANKLYQEDIKQLVEAQRLLTAAIAVLDKYYAKILKSEEALLQSHKEEPAPPSTWENDSFKGQSGKGTDAISMLKFILEETGKEEALAHKDEQEAQHAYEDSMSQLKAEEASLESSLANLQKVLAEKEIELLEKKADLKATIHDKTAIEAYLLKIKPGCDFITSKMSLRTTNRASETAALEHAAMVLKGTPAYQTAVASAHNTTLGDCLDECAGKEEHVVCKACLAKVTIPGYCAGHPSTDGC